MKRNRSAMGIGVLLVALLLGAIACSSKKGESAAPPASGGTAQAVTSDAPSGGTRGEVAVSLHEYQIQPQPATVPAGTVTFNAKNIGGTTHEMLVIRTDLAPTALPTKADGSVDEAGKGITVVDQIHEFAAQQQKSLTVDLAPGTYVLICNVVQKDSYGRPVSHYARGMAAAFIVTP
jgi:uncharacterized cupredoxin-like copper-binding protein